MHFKILFSGCGLGFVLFWGFFTHMLIGDVYARGQYIYAAQLLEIHEYFEIKDLTVSLLFFRTRLNQA